MLYSTLKIPLLLSLLFQIVLFWDKANSVDCSTATTSTACSAIAGCVFSSNTCSCDSSTAMDVVFAMDASGSIGATSFTKEKDFVAGLIQSAIPTDANISIVSFATDSDIILTWAQAAAKTTAQKVAFVNNITYTKGYTNTVGAIQDALTLFNYTTTRVKMFVLITDGNPNLPNGGDVEVCNYASSLKTSGITTLIVGVGSAWDPDQVDCLVTDTSKYIISVTDFDAFDDALPAITDVTCPVSYSLKITEAQIVQDNTTIGSRFFEVYNSGSDVSLINVYLDGFFTGALTTNSSLVLKQGQYLVVYDGTQSSPVNCTDCSCPKVNGICTDAVYIGCSSAYTIGCKASVDSTMTETNWEQILIDKSDFTKIDIVNYSSATWPTIIKGYSYELKSKGYSNDDGGNWDMSCNTYGTPGSDPITSCGCVQSGCRINGDSTATCGTSSCLCSPEYYSSGSTCYQVPPPGSCVAYHIKNNANEYLKYVWDRASTDISVKYMLTYPISNGEIQVLTSSRSYSVYDDYLLALVKTNTNADIGYVQTHIGNGTSDAVYCTYVTPEPTLAPTPAPTDYPRIWIGGDICKYDRCECNNKAWDCDCGEDLARWSCTVGEISKEFAESDDEQFITVKTWPADYVVPFTMCWTITPNGESDKSNSRRLLANDTEPSTTITGTGRADANDINILEGCLHFNGSDEQKIAIIIWDEEKLANNDAPYETFTLELVNCTHPVDCDILYPDVLLMEVEDAVYAAGLTEDDDDGGKGMPSWVWGLIAGLLLLLLLIGAMAYRWFVKNKTTQKKLDKTEADLEKEKEENELGFGHDLGQGDVGFNPLATGVPGKSHPSGGLAAEMETRQAIVGANVDAPAEKFQHRMEYGQTIPEKRK